MPWWSEDCHRAVRRKKAAFLKMKRTWVTRDILNFKKRRTEMRKTILEAKRQCWKRFCNMLGRNGDMESAWKIVRAFGGQYTFS